ncbi:MAG: phosphatidate cytidylyltransferase [Candidatus Brocadiae bacterium]|nr:phosphatidate cytidylyltransferase [Candidatus Brocadiia bacterium]
MRARLLTGIPMALATLGLLYADFARGGFPWGLSVLYILGLTWGMKEYLQLQSLAGVRLPRVMLCGITALLSSAHILEIHQARPLLPADLSLPDALLVTTMVAWMCYEVVRGEADRFRHIAVLFLGLFYIWVLGSFSMKLRHLPRIGEAAFLWWMVANKTTDAWAYFTGKAFGRHKLIPKVSPAKTVEGGIGGLVLGCASGLLVWWFTPLRQEIPLVLFIPLSLLSQVVGQFGDLVESLLKRHVTAKDSAALLPGLGGVLDVIDSLLLSAPVTYYGIVIAIRLKGNL